MNSAPVDKYKAAVDYRRWLQGLKKGDAVDIQFPWQDSEFLCGEHFPATVTGVEFNRISLAYVDRFKNTKTLRLPDSGGDAYHTITPRGVVVSHNWEVGYYLAGPVTPRPDRRHAPTPISFDQLREANIKRHAEWAGPVRLTLPYRCMELSGEVGELCNKIKKLVRARHGMKGTTTDMDEITSELADVVITLDLLAMDLGIDVAEAVKEKFNATSDKYDLKTRLGE